MIMRRKAKFAVWCVMGILLWPVSGVTAAEINQRSPLTAVEVIQRMLERDKCEEIRLAAIHFKPEVRR